VLRRPRWDLGQLEHSGQVSGDQDAQGQELPILEGPRRRLGVVLEPGGHAMPARRAQQDEDEETDQLVFSFDLPVLDQMSDEEIRRCYRGKGTGTITNRHGRWYATAPRMKGRKDVSLGHYERHKQAEEALNNWHKENP
jgi:hypothetical protein